jgi:hypothetical protein
VSDDLHAEISMVVDLLYSEAQKWGLDKIGAVLRRPAGERLLRVRVCADQQAVDLDLLPFGTEIPQDLMATPFDDKTRH